MIIAAAGADERRTLVELTKDARFGVGAVADAPAALAALLRADPAAWVVTGGTLTRARPFMRAARTAGAWVVAVLSGRAEAEDRLDLGYRGLAVLRAVPPTERFQAATVAVRAGLSAWDPDLQFPADAVDAIETPLSPRERRVLELTGAGLSTKSVARQLGISPNTVKFHLQAAFEKLDVTSRAEAVMVAIRRGELAV